MKKGERKNPIPKEDRTELWCKDHEQYLPIEQFSTDGKTTAGKTKYRSRCKECWKAHRKGHPSYRERLVVEQFIAEAKTHCTVCGYDRCQAALDFHHIDDTTKVDTVSNMVRNLAPFEEIRAEIEKCVVVCCRCHREHHAGMIEL
jgi:hypothetical protein